MLDIIIALFSLIYVHFALKFSAKYARAISETIDKLYKGEKD